MELATCDCIPIQPSHLFDGFHSLPDQGGVLALALLLTELSERLPVVLSLPLLPQTHTLGLLLEVCLLGGEVYETREVYEMCTKSMQCTSKQRFVTKKLLSEVVNFMKF